MWHTKGHDWATGLLEQTLRSGRLGHTYLITGPAHIGKATLAREFAAALNCTGATPPCGQCRACHLTGAGTHPDVLVVEPDEGTFKIEQVRELQRELALSPHTGRYRVCLLLDVHRATREAQNALLKTLEEPASRAVLVLTAADASLLLPTVVSRCQVLALRGVPVPVIAQALRERGVDPEQATLLGRLAAGRIGWALQAAADEGLLKARAQDLDTLWRAVTGGRLERIRVAETFSEREPEDLIELANLCQTWWRDVVLVGQGCDELVVNLDRIDALRSAASRSTPVEAAAACGSIGRLLDQLKQNVTARLAVEDMLFSWPVSA